MRQNSLLIIGFPCNISFKFNREQTAGPSRWSRKVNSRSKPTTAQPTSAGAVFDPVTKLACIIRWILTKHVTNRQQGRPNSKPWAQMCCHHSVREGKGNYKPHVRTFSLYQTGFMILKKKTTTTLTMVKHRRDESSNWGKLTHQLTCLLNISQGLMVQQNNILVFLNYFNTCYTLHHCSLLMLYDGCQHRCQHFSVL